MCAMPIWVPPAIIAPRRIRISPRIVIVPSSIHIVIVEDVHDGGAILGIELELSKGAIRNDESVYLTRLKIHIRSLGLLDEGQRGLVRCPYGIS